MGHILIRATLLAALPVSLFAVSFASQEASAEIQEPSAVQEEKPPAVPKGDETVDAAISGDELREHVKALSSDELRGRPMGSLESMVAAEYCAARFKAMGFAPGAEDGTYLQRIRMGRSVFKDVPELRVKTTDGESATLLNGEFFTFQSASLAVPTEPLRCVIVADEESMPKEADPKVALVLSTSAGKARRWLRAAGFPNGAGFGMVVIPRKGEAGEPRVPAGSPMRPVASNRGGLSVSLRAEWGERAAAGEIESIQFLPQADVMFRDDANVVAVLEGTDDAHKDKVVLLSAHRDHIGLSRLREGAPVPDDIICNGADDDASGCAIVMEICEALARGERPARTVVACLVTGEEAGMVGSTFWANNPTVPIESVVCALNFEMLGRPDAMVGGAGKLWLTGDDRSDLGPHLREKNVAVAADPRLEQNFFVRSDNVAFARKGIVSQTLSSFGGHSDYHRVSDEWDTLDYEHMETAAAACLHAVRVLVAGDWSPAWNEGEPRL